MLNLTRPKFFVPIHGEYRHRHHHARLAAAVGIDPEHIYLAENGDILEFTPDKGGIVGKVAGGRVFVDGKGIGERGPWSPVQRSSLEASCISRIRTPSVTRPDGW